jgi:hypothetical protein
MYLTTWRSGRIPLAFIVMSLGACSATNLGSAHTSERLFVRVENFEIARPSSAWFEPIDDTGGPREIGCALRESERGFLCRGLLPGVYDLYVISTKCAPFSMRVSVGREDERRVLAVTLSEGASVRGCVVDQRGVPLRGVKVVSEQPVGRTRLDLKATRTTDDGAFVLPGLEPARVWLRFHSAKEIENVSRETVAGTRELRVVLRDAGLVVGRLSNIARDAPGPGYYFDPAPPADFTLDPDVLPLPVGANGVFGVFDEHPGQRKALVVVVGANRTIRFDEFVVEPGCCHDVGTGNCDIGQD